MTKLLSASLQKEESFLDIPFSNDEVNHILQKQMKLNKSTGPDNLTTEHLRYGGNIVVTWLTEILNSIIELEQIPSPLKSGITTKVEVEIP